MMRTAFACAAAVAVLLSAGAASAQDSPEVAWNLGVTSDYVFRGYSQTSEDPAIFGGVDVTVGSFYAGAWASNVDFGDDTDVEVDIYGGYRTEVSGFAVDVGVVGYLYVSQPAGADYDYAEFKAAASRAFGPVTLGAAVYWSPDFFGADEEATYVEANAAFSPADRWTISGAVGRQFLSSDFDYTTWNLGVARQLTDNLALDVRFHDTDAHDFGDIYGSRAVVSLKAAF